MFSIFSWLCWLVFPDCLPCFWFLLVSSSLTAVVLSCGVCFGGFTLFLVVFFTMFLVCWFNLCLVVSTFLM